jgi:hypothetical protein
MTANISCECGHDKRDHALPVMGTQGYGQCKICLCNRYAKAQPRVVTAATAGSAR